MGPFCGSISLRPETASRTLLEHRAQSAERHLAVASEQDAEASTGRLRRLSLRLEEAEEEAESSGSGLARALAERQALELRLSAAEAAGKQMEAKASVEGRCRAVGTPFQHAASIFGPCLGL